MSKSIPLMLVLLLGIFLATPAHAEGNADVWVIHGIDGRDAGTNMSLPVDISVNGKCLLEAFTYTKIAGPLSLPPGKYTIRISPANKTKPCSNPALITAQVELKFGEKAAIIAHLDGAGKPTASKFSLDLSRAKRYEGRVILHHTAFAPAVDINLKRLGFWFRPQLTLKGVKNGDQGTVDLLAGLWRLSIAPAGTTAPVLGPIYGPVIPRLAYAIFVVGSVKNKTLNLILLPAVMK